MSGCGGWPSCVPSLRRRLSFGDDTAADAALAIDTFDAAPLGPWSRGRRISELSSRPDRSCRGGTLETFRGDPLVFRDFPVAETFVAWSQLEVRMSNLLAAAVASVTLAACAPIAGDVGVGGTVVAGPVGGGWGDPGLVWAAPGVQVYSGWNEPMFLVDNQWWWWNQNGWMGWGPGGWAWSQPPVALSTGIRDPWRFRSGATGFVAGRGWARGTVRDHRSWNGGGGWSPPVTHRANGGVWTGPARGTGARGFGPAVRDHRRR